MTFSEYALGLSPFISFGKAEHDYFTELVGNFIKDAAMDSCQILKRQPDTNIGISKETALYSQNTHSTFTTTVIQISSPNGYGIEWMILNPMTM